MEKTEVLKIAVLANDASADGKALGPGTKARCERAVAHIRQWLCQIPCSTFPAVFIYLAAGKGGRWRGETTFAVAMEGHMRDSLGNQTSLCTFVTNETRDAVWSTLAEMKWIYKELHQQRRMSLLSHIVGYEAVYIVTNQVHARRAGIIQKILLPDLEICGFVFSNEPAPPWWHEVAAYVKLLFHLLGFGGLIEPLRRRFYGG